MQILFFFSCTLNNILEHPLKYIQITLEATDWRIEKRYLKVTDDD